MAEAAKKFGITTIKGGIVEKLFDHGMDDLIENILDPNRDPKKKRVLTLTFELTPNSTRDEFQVAVGMETKGPGLMKVASHGFISRRDRKAYSNDVRQEEIDLEGAEASGD